MFAYEISGSGFEFCWCHQLISGSYWVNKILSDTIFQMSDLLKYFKVMSNNKIESYVLFQVLRVCFSHLWHISSGEKISSTTFCVAKLLKYFNNERAIVKCFTCCLKLQTLFLPFMITFIGSKSFLTRFTTMCLNCLSISTAHKQW